VERVTDRRLAVTLDLSQTDGLVEGHDPPEASQVGRHGTILAMGSSMMSVAP
jgi:hypothetical protein